MTALHARVPVRVAVQSPRRLLRDTLAACLAVRPDVAVVGRVAEPGGILALCELRRPDVVILDAGRQLAEMAGLVGALMGRFPELNVIVTYRDASEQDIAAVCQAGVASLIPESRGLAAVLALLGRKRRRHAQEARHERGGLTDREHEIIVLTGSGHSVSEIAALLGISPFTVENLKRRLYAKLDVTSGAGAVARGASLGLLEREDPPAAPRRRRAEGGSGVLAVVTGRPGPVLDQVVTVLLDGRLPFVLIRRPGLVAETHWARWHRGPIVAALVDPASPDWDLVAELGVPAVLVHSHPLDSPGLAEALAGGANALVAADRVADHFLSVLRMVGQGYLVVDSMPMRPLIGVVRARWGEQVPGAGGLPELTSRESDVLNSLACGHSVRQTARALGIAPKTVENVQTRLFRKLGVRNRPGALAVADAFGLLPPAGSGADGSPHPALPLPEPPPAGGRSR